MTARRATDAGVSSVEVVLLTPLIVMMILLIVSLGVMVNVRSEVAGAARDAARAGSLQGNGTDAEQQARSAVLADLGSRCAGQPTVTSAYVPPNGTGGGYYQVTVSCTVDMSGFGVFGAHQTYTKTFSSPIDPLQHFEPGPVPTTTYAPPTDQPAPTNTQFTTATWDSPTPPPSTPTTSTTSSAPTTPASTAGVPTPTTPAGQ
ncbi:hypothetical protein GCM10009839_04180 [Catenulispora yoronensis]|uniref:TadE-like domain-containing protein n=1 Tax=Catenulispora yoronensis TaxID=450799 RepID=A0ABP5F124_9ACTN